jgi:Na+/H+ antiporter NhaD/arsenite permease-like protein
MTIRRFLSGRVTTLVALVLVLAGLGWSGARASRAQEGATTEPAPAAEGAAPVEVAPVPKGDHDHAGDGVHADGDHSKEAIKGADDGHGAGDAHGAGGGHHGADLGKSMPVLATVPFIAILLAIAIFPLVAHHWWEHNSSKAIVSAALGLPMVGYLLVGYGADGWHELQHKLIEYGQFIVMLGALFVISGGIYVRGSLSGTPIVNTLLLAFGGAIASFVGTTGASMLLIRPLLRANAPRKQVAHIVIFFIFIVSNCGGLLTPLGDPPLFLGFLSGVPFTWTFRLWREWLFVNIALLVIFNVWDQIVLNKEEKERTGSQLEAVQKHEPLGIEGGFNILLLLGVVFTIYASGQGTFNGGVKWTTGIAEVILAALGLASYFGTKKSIHEANQFSFGPINEVAILFAGIFVTMIPALLILNTNGSKLGVNDPWEFFWASGMLSSFLDNAPTYLTFASVACGMKGVPLEGPYMLEFLRQSGAAEILAAISCGAVFMGANTYIGNGPNFMVKAIAEQRDVKMPSFFGYMAYSFGILVPLFVVVTLVFFRG